MIGTKENLSTIVSHLKKRRAQLRWIVWDPVIKASLEHPLVEKDTLSSFESLYPLVDIITPNLEEFQLLTGINLSKNPRLKELKRGVYILQKKGIKGIVVTGIKRNEFLMDYFFWGGRVYSCRKKRLPVEFHGTGCGFSSALLGFLLKNLPPEIAFKKAKNWLYLYLKKAFKSQASGGKLWVYL